MAGLLGLRGRKVDFRIVRLHMRTMFWGPLIVGALVMTFLATVPQSREVYLGIILGLYEFRGAQFFQALLGLALIILLCLLLHAWQRMLGTAAIDRIYPEHADIRTDRLLSNWRDYLSNLSALLPLLGLVVGLIRATNDARTAGNDLTEALKYFGQSGWKEMFAEFSSTTNVLPFFDKYGAVALALLVIAALLVLIFSRPVVRRIEERHIGSTNTLVLWIGAGVTVVALVFPMIPYFEPYVVGLTRLAGPLASAAIVLITFTCILILLSYMSNTLRVPIMGFLLMVCIVGFSVLTYHAVTPPPPKTASTEPGGGNPGTTATADLHALFDTWLEARAAKDWPKYRDANRDYPVFIVAAQGGGIYAAAATTAFLGAMQDVCPAFSQHVFAISAVSGGAVGAALFNALEANKELNAEGCDLNKVLSVGGTLSSLSGKIVRDDHLSPALALIWPDFARKVASLVGFDVSNGLDRSSALERSFACSFQSPGATGFSCDPEKDAGLSIPFASHWQPDLAAPALLLSTTWVETGYRVAFSPFKLHGLSDGTLFAFPSERQKAPNDFAVHGIGMPPPHRSLIGAAMVSARFPGIVPAYSVDAEVTGATSPRRRWNFVDGGYVDNSGASTAVDIYQKLQERIAEKASLPIGRPRLFLILLTDANYDPNLRDVEDGTRFSDTVAPISALLNVRSQLAGRAVTRAIEVTRAIDKIESKPTEASLTGRQLVSAEGGDRPSHIMIVNLKQDKFTLPLGWKISGITDDVVRLMLGRPDLCVRFSEKLGADDVRTVIRNNSCVKKQIASLLDATDLVKLEPDGDQ